MRQLQISVTYKQTITTTLADANLTDPNGGALTPQGFWGTIMSQGGESINGDLYASYYDNNGSTKTTSTYYNATNYYNYDVQMQPGSSNGQLWVYDAPFCASGSNGQYGTGDRWFNSQNGISTFYDLYDTKLTNDTSDDSLVWSSGNTFKETAAYSDPDLSGSGGSSCSKTTTTGIGPAGADGLGTQCDASATSGLDCHLRWYELPVTLTGGKLYRLHVSTTDPNSPSNQLSSDGHNSFTLWATAIGHRAACLRRGGHGDLRAAARWRGLHLLPGPDRCRTCRQDDGDQAVGPWRYEPAARQPEHPGADHDWLHRDGLLLERPEARTRRASHAPRRAPP